MLDRRRLAGQAAFEALSLRRRLGIPIDHAVNPIDSAETLGIDVRLVDIPTMEGIYLAADKPAFLLSSLRPQGRRHFTCAHEIGHYALGHGQQFEELVDERSARRTVDPIEFIADCFAGFFLMPKAAVDSGMARRQYAYSSLSPFEAYTMSNWLGVGYETFVAHLQYALKTLTNEQASQLRKSTPKSIRSAVAPASIGTSLHVVDHSWIGRPIDCEVGDYLLLPPTALCEGAVVGTPIHFKEHLLVQIESMGIGRVSGILPF